jgi:hypothetical protein
VGVAIGGTRGIVMIGLGQGDISVRPPQRVRGNLPNARQRQQWSKAVDLLDKTDDNVALLGLLGFNAGIMWQWCQQNNVRMQKPDLLESKTLALKSKVDELKQLVRKVEDRQLGLQFRGGDIDIVEPQSDFSGIVVLIVVGAIVYAALVAAVVKYHKESEKLRTDYNNLLNGTEQFIKTQAPEKLHAWKTHKQQSGFSDRQSIIQQIGSSMKTGAKWGIGLAVAIALMGLAWQK